MILWFTAARRRADIKRKKLKTLGKSKSTESEEECEEEEADEGKYNCSLCVAIAYGVDSGMINPAFLLWYAVGG